MAEKNGQNPFLAILWQVLLFRENLKHSNFSDVEIQILFENLRIENSFYFNPQSCLCKNLSVI